MTRNSVTYRVVASSTAAWAFESGGSKQWWRYEWCGRRETRYGYFRLVEAGVAPMDEMVKTTGYRDQHQRVFMEGTAQTNIPAAPQPRDLHELIELTGGKDVNTQDYFPDDGLAAARTIEADRAQTI